MCQSLEERLVLRPTAVALRDVPGGETPVPAVVGRGGARVGLAWPAAVDEVRAAGYTHGVHVHEPGGLPGVGARPRDSVPGALGCAQRRCRDARAARARVCSRHRLGAWTSRGCAGDAWAGGGSREGQACWSWDQHFRSAGPRCAVEEEDSQQLRSVGPARTNEENGSQQPVKTAWHGTQYRTGTRCSFHSACR